jgi:hypothetical protein
LIDKVSPITPTIGLIVSIVGSNKVKED